MNAQLAAGQLDRADIRVSREGLHFCLRSSRRCRSVQRENGLFEAPRWFEEIGAARHQVEHACDKANRCVSCPCPFRKSYPDVLMIQSGQDWNGDNDARPLDCSMQGCILR